MLKMDSAGRNSVSQLISNTIPEGHSVENFLKKNMLLKSVTMKNKSTEKINIVLSSSRSIKERSRQKKIVSRFNKNKKVKFIDELDKTKSLCEVVEIESFKVYNIDISEEGLTQKCTCLFF